MSDLTYGLDALDQALPAYLEAERFYEGNANEVFTSKALQKALGGDSDKFNFNYAKIAVTSRLDRMEVASITSEDGTADEALADMWSRNDMDQEVKDALEAALEYGDSYLIVGQDEDGQVEVFFNDPKNTRVFYQAENPRKKAFAIKRWIEGKYMRVNLYYKDRIEKYVSKGEPTPNMEDGDFQPYSEDGQSVWPLPNDSGEIPVFHLRTSRMYGKPEHAQAYGPQNAINKLIATQVSNIDYTSAPQRYALEDLTAKDGISTNDFVTGKKTQDKSETEGLKSGPGEVWMLKGFKSVGQFEPANPEVFVVPFKNFIEAMSTVTSTPMHSFNVGALPSGESLRAAEAPLNKRVESLSTLFGGVLREMSEYALDTYGFENAKVLVYWNPPATYDDADVWAVVEAKTAAGVPLRTALKEAGYTDTQVNEWYPEGTPAYSPTQLAKIAEAMQKLAAASSMGVLSVEEIRALLPEDMLTGDTPIPDTVLDSLNGMGL